VMELVLDAVGTDEPNEADGVNVSEREDR
jgi:hypothetical protein